MRSAMPIEPAGLVRAFLAAMEARDLSKARSFLAEGFVMTFPGGVRMGRLEELLTFSAQRYRVVRKAYHGFDTVPDAGGNAVVYCFGTLSGEWPDGTAFAGIRFVDRFEIAGGRLVRQDVWNDLAEVRSRNGGSA